MIQWNWNWKWNWGKGLATAIILFMCATLGFVFFALTLDFDLVEEQYYEKSVKYQQHINSVSRVDKLNGSIEFTTDNDVLVITLPAFFHRKQLKSNLHFYRPDNERLDVQMNGDFNQNHTQKIPLDQFKSGKWLLKLSITANGTDYYEEYQFFVD